MITSPPTLEITSMVARRAYEAQRDLTLYGLGQLALSSTEYTRAQNLASSIGTVVADTL